MGINTLFIKPTVLNSPRHIARLFRFICMLLVLLCAIPAAAQEVKKSKKTETVEGKKYYLHTVDRGQTLYAIAKAYELSVNDILVENPDALNGIKPGQVLRIPFQRAPVVMKPVVPDSNFIIHKVVAGQTMYSIAAMYKMPQDSILKYNPEARAGLKAGQELKIPGKRTVTVVPLPGAGDDTLYVGRKKDLYHVALMLPLQLWNVQNIDPEDKQKTFPPKTEAAVQFYEGALLALDSMKKRGMKVKLHVYDVDDGDSAKMNAILDKPEFKLMDLIIGPLTSGPFDVASEWAKEHHVAIVSPVSPANKVLFKRPDAAKALPSVSTQLENLATFVAAKHKTDNVIMITSGNLKEAALANGFRSDVSRLLYPSGNDTIPVTRGMTGVNALLKPGVTNVLLIPSSSQAFVSDVLRQLYTLSEKDKYTFVVYGMSTWMGYDNLDPEYLEKLQLHFVAPYFVDYDSSAATTRFLRRYSDVFSGDAGLYTFTGYDVTLFFLEALYTHGTDFYYKLPELKGEGLQQRFEFFRSDAESGYENRGTHILMIRDYRLVKAK